MRKWTDGEMARVIPSSEEMPELSVIGWADVRGHGRCSARGGYTSVLLVADGAPGRRSHPARMLFCDLWRDDRGTKLDVAKLRRVVKPFRMPPTCARCENKAWVDCRKCGGSGDTKPCPTCKHASLCKACNGLGRAPCTCARAKSVGYPASRSLRIGAHCIDAGKLRGLLSVIDDSEAVQWAWIDRDDAPALTLRGDGWCFVLMALLVDTCVATYDEAP